MKKKQEEEDERYPGLTKQQLERLEQRSRETGISKDELYRKVIPAVSNQNTLNDREAELNQMKYNETKETDNKEIKKQLNRVGELAQKIKKAYKSQIPADADDDDVISTFVIGLQNNGYSDAYKDYANYIKNGGDEFFTKYNLEDNTFKEETGISGVGIGAGLGAIGLGGAYGLTELGGGIENLGKKIYGKNIPTTDVEALRLERAGEYNERIELDIDSTKKEIKDIKNQMKGLEGEEKEALQKTLDEKENLLKELKGKETKEVSTATDTALKYGLKGTKEQIAEKAGAMKGKIWDEYIQPIIDSSTERVNLKDVFKEFEDEVKAEIDPINGKQVSETNKALKKLNTWYNRNSDLESVSLQELQDLKSSIQKDLKNIYQKQAKNGEISKEDELLERYANKLKTTLQDELQKLAPNEDIKQKYKERGDLDNISWEGVKEKKKKGNVKDSFVRKAWQTAESRVGRKLAKKGERLDNANKWVKDVVKKGGKTLKSLVKRGGVFGMFEDGSIIPGSPTNIAQEAIDLNKQYAKDKNSVYEGNNGMIYSKEKVDKAIEKAKKEGAPEGVFFDIYGNAHLLDNGTVKDIY